MPNLARRRILGAAAAAVLALGVGAAIATVSLAALDTARLEEVQSREMLLAMEHVYSALQDAETGARGYVLTGNPALLKPYEKAVRRIPRLLEHLHDVIRHQVNRERQFDELKRLAVQKLRTLAVEIEAERTGDHDKATSLITAGGGQAAMDGIRLVQRSMREQESTLLRGRIVSNANATFKVGLSLAMLIATGLLLILLLTYESIREARVAESARLKLSAALEAARAADRAKSMFLATVSHELRTPLNPIIGFSDLLLFENFPESDVERRKQLGFINRAGKQMLALVNDILDMSSIEAGHLALRIERVNLTHMLTDQCEELQLQALERRLDLKLVGVDSEIFVNADSSRLEQVIRNLLTNAIKFTVRGGISVGATVTQGAARIEIEDTGVGIPADQQDKLFNRFQRVVGQSGELRPGTGLGLAICRRLVEAMGGSIGYTSEVGRGSRFWFTIPLAPGLSARG